MSFKLGFPQTEIASLQPPQLYLTRLDLFAGVEVIPGSPATAAMTWPLGFIASAKAGMLAMLDWPASSDRPQGSGHTRLVESST